MKRTDNANLINDSLENMCFGEKVIPAPIGQLEWFFFGGLLCLIPVVWFIIAILLCVWVYRDAQSRGMNGALWLIIVLLFGLLGLIVYLIVRHPRTT
jgi:hypothetical protein